MNVSIMNCLVIEPARGGRGAVRTNHPFESNSLKLGVWGLVELSWGANPGIR
jgi:hypothetical protein